MKSLFITFEGIEGSGKSTQTALLSSRLREKGFEIVVTREPGGTRIGEEIRNITHSRENVDLTAVAETYLMCASRAQHVREIIKPALKAGKIVICDRFLDSSLAYQGYGRELGEEIVEEMNKLAVEGCLPNLTFLLDLPVEEGFTRRNHSDKVDRLDLQQQDFYQRVRAGYKKLAERYKERFVTVNSSKPLDDVAQAVWEKVNILINKY